MPKQKKVIFAMYDYQPAPFMKRLSAFMLDIMLLISAATGFIFGLSALTGYDGVNEKYHELVSGIAEEYQFNIEMTTDEYSALTEDEQKEYNDKQLMVNQAIAEDDETMQAYLRLTTLMIMNLSIGILCSYLLFEFAVPLFFKNGMTVGKKVFGVAVMRTDSVKIQPVQLFVRSILGKYTVETMIPVLLVMMIFYGNLGIIGVAVIFAFLILQFILYCSTEKKQPIHDIIASTCTCNYASQGIFMDNEEKDRYFARK